MASVVYLLCSVLSGACAFFLVRAYLSVRTRFLLWSSLCFIGMGVNNLLLFIDLALLPYQVDLALLRHSVSVVALGVLIYGFIQETQ